MRPSHLKKVWYRLGFNNYSHLQFLQFQIYCVPLAAYHKKMIEIKNRNLKYNTEK